MLIQVPIFKTATRRAITQTIRIQLQSHYLHILLSTKNLVLYSTKKSNWLIKQDLRCMQFFQYSKTIAVENEVLELANSLFKQSPEKIDSEKYNEVIKVLNYLVSCGYSLKEIKDKGLNHLKPQDSSLDKIKQIEQLDPDILNLIPFMSLSASALRKAVQQAREDKYEIKGFVNRIAYLSFHLETPVEELIPYLAKHSALITMKFSRLHCKMAVFKDAEISPQDLVKDLWIFNYSENLLTNRISIAAKAKVHLKPWMLRCSGRFFTSIINKYSETHRILGGDDMNNYLSKKLDCSTEYVKYMMEKNVLLKTINIPKIDQITNFLLEKGYTLQEIRIYPTVFCAKIETLDRRLQVFTHIRKTLPSLSQLCLSEKAFQEKLEKWKIKL